MIPLVVVYSVKALNLGCAVGIRYRASRTKLNSLVVQVLDFEEPHWITIHEKIWNKPLKVRLRCTIDNKLSDINVVEFNINPFSDSASAFVEYTASSCSILRSKQLVLPGS